MVQSGLGVHPKLQACSSITVVILKLNEASMFSQRKLSMIKDAHPEPLTASYPYQLLTLDGLRR
jgi:hypothetical protein